MGTSWRAGQSNHLEGRRRPLRVPVRPGPDHLPLLCPGTSFHLWAVCPSACELRAGRWCCLWGMCGEQRCCPPCHTWPRSCLCPPACLCMCLSVSSPWPYPHPYLYPHVCVCITYRQLVRPEICAGEAFPLECLTTDQERVMVGVQPRSESALPSQEVMRWIIF